MAPYGSADQGMAEWSNNGDPDDYPPRWLSRGACKAGRVGVLDQVHNTLHPAPDGAFRAESAHYPTWSIWAKYILAPFV